MKKAHPSAVLLGILYVTAGHAAVINWAGPFDVTSVADISTDGTGVYAYNYGVPTAYTLNGVTFAGNNTGGGSATAATAATWGTDTFTGYGTHSVGGDYAAALSSGRYTTSGSTPVVSLTGLTAGNSYQVQIWFSDMRNTVPDSMRIYSGANLSGPNVVLTTDSDGAAGGTNLAQYTLGSFVADAATQDMRLKVELGGGGPTMNMLQLRDITAVPEPSTYGLAGAAALAGVVAVRRRRRR